MGGWVDWCGWLVDVVGLVDNHGLLQILLASVGVWHDWILVGLCPLVPQWLTIKVANFKWFLSQLVTFGGDRRGELEWQSSHNDSQLTPFVSGSYCWLLSTMIILYHTCLPSIEK